MSPLRGRGLTLLDFIAIFRVKTMLTGGGMELGSKIMKNEATAFIHVP